MLKLYFYTAKFSTIQLYNIITVSVLKGKLSLIEAEIQSLKIFNLYLLRILHLTSSKVEKMINRNQIITLI